MLKDKQKNYFLTVYVLNKIYNTLKLITRSSSQIEIIKLQYSDANRKKFYGLYSEYTQYIYNTSDNIYYETIEY